MSWILTQKSSQNSQAQYSEKPISLNSRTDVSLRSSAGEFDMPFRLDKFGPAFHNLRRPKCRLANYIGSPPRTFARVSQNDA